jgi:hypothetical protein
MRNFVISLLILVDVTLVTAQQRGCYPVDTSTYSSSEACAGLSLPSGFPTQACGYENPIQLNGSSGACSNASFSFAYTFAQLLCPLNGYTRADFCGAPPTQYKNLPIWPMLLLYYGYCSAFILPPCSSNAECNPPPAPIPPPLVPAPQTLVPAPQTLPYYCYDCCLLCFGNASACESSYYYGSLYRMVNQTSAGCASCSSTPSSSSSPTPTSSPATPSSPPPTSSPATPSSPTSVTPVSSYNTSLATGTVLLSVILAILTMIL